MEGPSPLCKMDEWNISPLSPQLWKELSNEVLSEGFVVLLSLHRCPALGCPRAHCLDQPVPRDRPGGVLHWPGQSLQFWWRWTHSKWWAKSPGKWRPKNWPGTTLVFLWFGVWFFSGVCRRGCKTFTPTRAWPLSGKRTLLVDSCRQISDANNLLILLPYNPHNVCCLNIPSFWVVQIQHVPVCSFPVVWALVNCPSR